MILSSLIRRYSPPACVPLNNAFVLLTCLACTSFTLAQDPAAESTAGGDLTPVWQPLDQVIRYELEQKEIPAFSIAIVVDDQIAWSAGYGFQDAARTQPATAETVYRVGSVSKLLTDIAVMQQVERGTLDLDAPIQEYLPEFLPANPFDIPITLRQLMSHRSGLVREPPVGHYFDPTEPTLEATVASLNRTKLVYQPLSRTKYSNAAIAVVGLALQRTVDTDFADHLRTSVLEPLGMTRSSFTLDDGIKDDLADAMMWTYNNRRFPAPTFALGTSPAGNLYASVNDLCQLIRCVLRDGEGGTARVLDPQALQTMLEPQRNPDGEPLGFGIGFQVKDFDGFQKVGHGGAVYGFSTQLEILPERRIGIAAVSALDGSNAMVRRICDHALRSLLAVQDGKAPPQYRRTGPVPPQRAAAMEGVYRDGDQQARVVHVNDQLHLWHGSYRQRLGSATNDGTILTDDVFGPQTEVQLDGDGNLRIGDKTYAAIDDRVAPPPPPRNWQGLIGEYGWDHNILFIYEKAGRLHALIEWFYDYPLTEVGEDRFAFPDYGLYHGEHLQFSRTAGIADAVIAAEVEFKRRPSADLGETFKIVPLKPIDQLRRDALAAEPPIEDRPRQSELVEVTSLDDTVQLDIRYATRNNFMDSVFYEQPKAFLQRPAAEALVRVHQKLRARRLGLQIYDAYRPWFVTKMFWDATPLKLRDFVANPALGSRHNRGCAVDLTLFHLDSGQPVEMVAGYDEFSTRAFPEYPGGTSRGRYFRTLLRNAMEAEGFSVYEFEWWHFDYRDWQLYPIETATFEMIKQTEQGKGVRNQ